MRKTLRASLTAETAVTALAPRRKVLLVGDGAAGLALEVTAQRACDRLPVRIVCGDNRFDPYLITRFARLKSVRPADALSSILIARAFTAYQLVELVRRLDPAVNDFVIVSGVCSAFFDDDLSDTDAARLFYRAFWCLRRLAQAGACVLLVESSAPPAGRRHYFLTDLMENSEVVLSMGSSIQYSEWERKSAKVPTSAFLPGS